MKNILLISSIYPGSGVPSNFTLVVHYFAKEWVKMGYDVKVVHTSNYFPKIYYYTPKFIREWISTRKGFALPIERLNKEKTFCIDNVSVFRIPMKKIIPGKNFSKVIINKATNRIKEILNKEEFIPDFIIGHWVIPQAEIIYNLKQTYKCPVSLVLHDDGSTFKLLHDYKKIIDSIDVWGYRSEKIKKNFEISYGIRPYSFRCYSGIPESYLENVPTRNWEIINKFIYVGMLIERKHPDKVITSLNKVYKNYHLDIIGEGGMKKQLVELTENLRCNDKVNFTGRIDRTEIIHYLDKADIFIMISENEVFGLVYLEAMSRGCIVVASKGEGMQGIIKDGINGFLCSPGDGLELENILKKIVSLTQTERKIISENAKETAKEFTDYSVAKSYIMNIVNYNKTF